MARRSISPALVFTVAFALLVALLITGALPSPVAVADIRCDDEYRPPNLSYDDCNKTQTAEIAGPTSTSAPGGGGGAAQATATRTAGTVTATRSAAPTAAASTTTLAATATPTATRQANVDLPSPTPSTVLPAGVAALVCVPGASVSLVGEAAPGTPLLAFFDGRPVGGGFSRADGSFSIDLLIGDERPGLYLIEVRERDSLALAGQFGCEVPAVSPTPTLVAVP